LKAILCIPPPSESKSDCKFGYTKAGGSMYKREDKMRTPKTLESENGK